jgi:hypothetical protein
MNSANLISRLEIVSDQLFADNLKPMGATVNEAIEELKKMDSMRELLDHIVHPKKEYEIDCGNCAASSKTCPIYEYRYSKYNKIKILECGDYDPLDDPDHEETPEERTERKWAKAEYDLDQKQDR